MTLPSSYRDQSEICVSISTECLEIQWRSNGLVQSKTRQEILLRFVTNKSFRPIHFLWGKHVGNGGWTVQNGTHGDFWTVSVTAVIVILNETGGHVF